MAIIIVIPTSNSSNNDRVQERGQKIESFED